MRIVSNESQILRYCPIVTVTGAYNVEKCFGHSSWLFRGIVVGDFDWMRVAEELFRVHSGQDWYERTSISLVDALTNSLSAFLCCTRD